MIKATYAAIISTVTAKPIASGAILDRVCEFTADISTVNTNTVVNIASISTAQPGSTPWPS